METSAKSTRPSRTTRAKIVRAASRAFAQHGYEGASIRTIVGQADVNQAAINYHFGSKEELFRAVLQTALCALVKDDDRASNPSTLSPEAALRRFVRRQLRPSGRSRRGALTNPCMIGPIGPPITRGTAD